VKSRLTTADRLGTETDDRVERLFEMLLWGEVGSLTMASGEFETHLFLSDGVVRVYLCRVGARFLCELGL
jgi:hypothetical protein